MGSFFWNCLFIILTCTTRGSNEFTLHSQRCTRLSSSPNSVTGRVCNAFTQHTGHQAATRDRSLVWECVVSHPSKKDPHLEGISNCTEYTHGSGKNEMLPAAQTAFNCHVLQILSKYLTLKSGLYNILLNHRCCFRRNTAPNKEQALCTAHFSFVQFVYCSFLFSTLKPSKLFIFSAMEVHSYNGERNLKPRQLKLLPALPLNAKIPLQQSTHTDIQVHWLFIL